MYSFTIKYQENSEVHTWKPKRHTLRPCPFVINVNKLIFCYLPRGTFWIDQLRHEPIFRRPTWTQYTFSGSCILSDQIRRNSPTLNARLHPNLASFARENSKMYSSFLEMREALMLEERSRVSYRHYLDTIAAAVIITDILLPLLSLSTSVPHLLNRCIIMMVRSPLSSLRSPNVISDCQLSTALPFWYN